MKRPAVKTHCGCSAQQANLSFCSAFGAAVILTNYSDAVTVLQRQIDGDIMDMRGLNLCRRLYSNAGLCLQPYGASCKGPMDCQQGEPQEKARTIKRH